VIGPLVEDAVPLVERASALFGYTHAGDFFPAYVGIIATERWRACCRRVKEWPMSDPRNTMLKGAVDAAKRRKR
jgi:hypothetical protein